MFCRYTWDDDLRTGVKLTHDDDSSRHSTPSPESSTLADPPILEEENRVEPDGIICDITFDGPDEIQSQDELDVISQRRRSPSLERHILQSSTDDDLPIDEAPVIYETTIPSLFTPPHQKKPLRGLNGAVEEARGCRVEASHQNKAGQSPHHPQRSMDRH